VQWVFLILFSISGQTSRRWITKNTHIRAGIYGIFLYF